MGAEKGAEEGMGSTHGAEGKGAGGEVGAAVEDAVELHGRGIPLVHARREQDRLAAVPGEADKSVLNRDDLDGRELDDLLRERHGAVPRAQRLEHAVPAGAEQLRPTAVHDEADVPLRHELDARAAVQPAEHGHAEAERRGDEGLGQLVAAAVVREQPDDGRVLDHVLGREEVGLGGVQVAEGRRVIRRPRGGELAARRCEAGAARAALRAVARREQGLAVRGLALLLQAHGGQRVGGAVDRAPRGLQSGNVDRARCERVLELASEVLLALCWCCAV